MSQASLTIGRPLATYRIAVGTLFFLQGICFATWASRIPSIQERLRLSESLLGVVLFALPVGSMLSLLFSGKLVARHGSQRMATIALLLYGAALPVIALAQNPWALIVALVLFGATGNLSNIAINTQAVQVESKYGRSIMASFHGLWSLAGFAAAGIGQYATGAAVTPLHHFLLAGAFILTGITVCSQFLVADKGTTESDVPLFVKPDGPLLKLGLIAFCCMICEGAMFDWSGIYFKNVVKPDAALIGLGYSAFMCAMASGRFIADWVTNKLGIRRTITFSGALITTGLLLSVLLPNVYMAALGFIIVGFGVSSVVPLIYSEAGKSSHTSPGMALTAVSSVSFLGFLVGPPLIGVVAGASSLRASFSIIAMMGLCIVYLVTRTFRSPNR